jgi:hypothetical protein
MTLFELFENGALNILLGAISSLAVGTFVEWQRQARLTLTVSP